MTLTQERLRQVLHYDPATGVFTRLVATSNSVAAGDVPATVGSHGYLQVNVDGILYLQHRLAWFYMTGEWPIGDVDHRNQVKTCNRWDNLRESTRARNMANISGRKGCFFHKASGLWRSEIRYDGKKKSLGYFKDEESATEFYRLASVMVHGEFSPYAKGD